MSAPESPSAVLRRAASLVRERARAASPGPWRVSFTDGALPVVDSPDHLVTEPRQCLYPAHAGRPLADATWAAGMHPVVGLALAELLESFASCECGEGDDHFPQKSAALKVARLVLGSAETEGAQAEAEEPVDDGEFELAAILARHPGATFPELARAVLADGRFGRVGGGRG